MSSADSVGELEVQLRADVGRAAAGRLVVEVRDQRTGEDRRPHPGHVEPGRAERVGSAAAAGSIRASI